MRNLRAKLTSLAAYTGLTAGWTAASVRLPDGHFREIAMLLWLLIVPGYIAWRAIAGNNGTRVTLKTSSYVVGLSLLFLMVLGVSLSEVYTLIGASRPLSRLPLTAAIGASVFGLSAVAAARTTRFPHWPSYKRRLLKRFKQKVLTGGMLAAGLLLPLLAVLGATTLNNGGAGGLAVVGMMAAAALFVLLLIREQDLGRFYGYALYCICAGILLATSMRGWNITGHDVMQEYQVFQLTLSHAAWHMNYYHDAYTACLSITVLPTILQQISGVDAPYIFKFVFQIVFAIIAVIMYGSLRTYVSRRIALLATFLFITFPTFITDMAMLNRQEMGLLFFALVLHTGTNRQLSRRLRSVLIFLFMTGMILSHYSTSYVAIGALVAAFGIGLVWKLADPSLRRLRKVNISALTSMISPIVLLASLLVLVGWGTIATQTSTNLTQTIQSIDGVLHGSQSAPSAVLAHSAPSASQYSAVAVQTRTSPSSSYYPKGTVAKYPLQNAPETVESDTSFARTLHMPAQLLKRAYDILRGGYALLIEACVSLGVIYMAFKKRTPATPPRQYILLGMGIMVMVSLQILMPSAIDYGLTRMLQQALVVLALPTILIALWVLHLVRIPKRAAEIVIGLVLAVFFLILSGALAAVTGGYKPALTTANSGFYYEAYYTHPDEIAAASWLAHEPPKGSQVYTDEFMRRKLIAYGGIFAHPTLVPGAIAVDSYVMLSHGNLEFDQVAAYDSGNLIGYKPPIAFLQANKNLVYSSGDVQIYK